MRKLILFAGLVAMSAAGQITTSPGGGAGGSATNVSGGTFSDVTLTGSSTIPNATTAATATTATTATNLIPAAVQIIRTDGSYINFLASTPGGNGIQLSNAALSFAAGDTIRLAPLDYYVSNSIAFPENSTIWGNGARLFYYGKTNATSTVHSICLVTSNNAAFYDLTVSNVFNRSWYQTCFGSDARGSSSSGGMSNGPVSFTRCTFYAYTDIAYYWTPESDDAPPVVTINMTDCAINYQWDGFRFGYVDTASSYPPTFLCNFIRCNVSNFGSNSFTYFPNGQDSSSLFKNGIDSGSVGTGAEGLYAVLDKTTIRHYSPTNTSAIFGGFPPVAVTNWNTSVWSDTFTNHPVTVTAYTGLQQFGLVFTNGVQYPKPPL